MHNKLFLNYRVKVVLISTFLTKIEKNTSEVVQNQQIVLLYPMEGIDSFAF